MFGNVGRGALWSSKGLLGAGGCRQTTVGSQMLMVAGLLLAWAGTNLPARPIRKTSEEGSAKYHLQLSLGNLSELK